MTVNITLPQFGSLSKSSRDAIISTLAEKWPLSTKEIHSKLTKEHSLQHTYQATHKTLLQLEHEGVLEKQGRSYSLSKRWINQVNDFSQKLKDIYSSHQSKYKVKPNFTGTLNFHFDDLSVLAVTFAAMLASRVLIDEKDNDFLIALMTHAMWPLRFNFTDFDLLAKMGRNNPKAYSITRENLPFDQWIVKQYKIIAKPEQAIQNIELGEKWNDLFIHGNVVIQLKYSEETKKYIEEVYSKISNVQDLFAYYSKRQNPDVKISVEVSISKNPEIASMLRTQLLKVFEGNSV